MSKNLRSLSETRIKTIWVYNSDKKKFLKYCKDDPRLVWDHSYTPPGYLCVRNGYDKKRDFVYCHWGVSKEEAAYNESKPLLEEMREIQKRAIARLQARLVKPD